MPDVKEKSQSKIMPLKNDTIAVIIVAAGRGSRAQTELPKQYCTLLGKSVLACLPLLREDKADSKCCSQLNLLLTALENELFA